MKPLAAGHLRRCWISGLRVLLGCLLVGPAWLGRGAQLAGTGSGQPIITNLLGIRTLSVEQAQAHPPLEVTGIVTWLNSVAKGCFLDDGVTAIWVDSALPEGLPRGLQLGSRLRAIGYAHAGFFTPAITMKEAALLGTAPLPTPRPARAWEQLLGRWDGLLVVMEGTLFQTRDSAGLAELRVLSDGVAVALAGPEETNAVFSGLPRRVRVTGISSLAVRERQPLDCTLLLDSWKRVQLLPPDGAAPEVVPIGGLVAATNGVWLDRLVRLDGVVTWRGYGRCVIQDRSGGMMVAVTNGPSPALRAEVQVVGGGLHRSPERMTFVATAITTGPPVTLPEPRKLSDQDQLLAPAFNGQRVSLSGRLVRRQWTANSEEWLMVRPDRPEHFRVLLPSVRTGASLEDSQVDSTFEITGVLQREGVAGGRVSDALLLVAEDGDVRLLNAPPLSRRWSVG